MFINKAYAQAVDNLAALESEIPPMPPEQGAGDLLFQNLMVLFVLIILFYFLLIRPQQKRLQEHTKMLKELQKGDRVVTGGGLIGTVEKVIEDKDEIILDLGDMKVTALRSTIHRKDDPRLRDTAANDKGKAASKDKAGSKDEVAKAKDDAAKKAAGAKKKASGTKKK